MDEDQLSVEDAALQRSRLHISSVKILLDHGKFIHAIATAYDAIENAMKWYTLTQYKLEIENLPSEPLEIFEIIKDREDYDQFDFEGLQKLMLESIDADEEPELTVEQFWQDMTSFLEFLEVMPFDLEVNPEDDPRTRGVLGI